MRRLDLRMDRRFGQRLNDEMAVASTASVGLSGAWNEGPAVHRRYDRGAGQPLRGISSAAARRVKHRDHQNAGAASGNPARARRRSPACRVLRHAAQPLKPGGAGRSAFRQRLRQLTDAIAGPNVFGRECCGIRSTQQFCATAWPRESGAVDRPQQRRQLARGMHREP